MTNFEWTPEWFDTLGQGGDWTPCCPTALASASLAEALTYVRLSQECDRKEGFEGDFVYRVRSLKTGATIIVTLP